MKRIIFCGIFILCLCNLVHAQNQEADEEFSCPTFSVEGPTEAVKAGETMTFAAVISSERQKFEFEWNVSGGEIVSGGDGSEIQVATTPDMGGLNITAFVRIKDLPETCNSEASGYGSIEQVRISQLIKVDEYSNLSPRDEFARFKNLFTESLREPGTKAYITFDIGTRESPATVKARLINIFGFLDENKFDRNWLIIDVCRSEVNKTIFQIIPNGAEYPNNEECDKVYIDFEGR